MKLSKEALAHSYRRAKGFVSSAWDKTKYAFDTADKLATLTAHGMLALGDRVDPAVRGSTGRALQQYSNVSQKFKNLHGNVGRVQDAIRDVGFEL